MCCIYVHSRTCPSEVQKSNITVADVSEISASEMNICDSVTTSTVRGRRPHFRDALIEENILYFTLIWGFFTTIHPPPCFLQRLLEYYA
jgi:hypothetical protein